MKRIFSLLAFAFLFLPVLSSPAHATHAPGVRSEVGGRYFEWTGESVTAYNATNEQRLWTKDTDYFAEYPPFATDARVYVFAGHDLSFLPEEWWVLDANDGSILQRGELNCVPKGAIAAFGDGVVAPCWRWGNDTFGLIDVSTGALVSTPIPSRGDDLVLADPWIIVPGSNTIPIWRLENGTIKPVSSQTRSLEPGDFALHDQTLFSLEPAGLRLSLSAVRLEDGEVVWQSDCGPWTGAYGVAPAVANGVVVAGEHGTGFVHGYSQSDGRLLWNFTFPPYISEDEKGGRHRHDHAMLASVPRFDGNQVLLQGSDGQTYSVDAATGATQSMSTPAGVVLYDLAPWFAFLPFLVLAAYLGWRVRSNLVHGRPMPGPQLSTRPRRERTLGPAARGALFGITVVGSLVVAGTLLSILNDLLSWMGIRQAGRNYAIDVNAVTIIPVAALLGVWIGAHVLGRRPGGGPWVGAAVGVPLGLLAWFGSAFGDAFMNSRCCTTQQYIEEFLAGLIVFAIFTATGFIARARAQRLYAGRSSSLAVGAEALLWIGGGLMISGVIFGPWLDDARGLLGMRVLPMLPGGIMASLLCAPLLASTARPLKVTMIAGALFVLGPSLIAVIAFQSAPHLESFISPLSLLSYFLLLGCFAGSALLVRWWRPDDANSGGNGI